MTKTPPLLVRARALTGFSELVMALGGNGYRQTVELCCLWAVKALRMLSGETADEWQVIFTHQPGIDLARYRELFGCDVSFEQPGNGVLFPQILLERPINGRNPQIRAEAERFVAHLIRRNPLDLACQIEELVARQLADGGCVACTELMANRHLIESAYSGRGNSSGEVSTAT